MSLGKSLEFDTPVIEFPFCCVNNEKKLNVYYPLRVDRELRITQLKISGHETN